jgi:hypothetical protein
MNQSAQSKLVWILGSALIVALLVIAFLAGRESQSESPRAAVAEAPLESPPPPSPEERPVPAVVPAEGGTLSEVVAYFAKVDRIQAGPTGVSADAFAQQIAGEAAQGKTEGFERLQKDLDRMEQELGEITAPPSCQKYHQLTLATVADTKMLMLDLRRVFVSGEASGAEQIAARANAAQARTKEIEAERKVIEQRYGLGR